MRNIIYLVMQVKIQAAVADLEPAIRSATIGPIVRKPLETTSTLATSRTSTQNY